MADKPLLSDYKCPICLELLIEPVVMPCNHELCRPCFRHNVEEANFVCPICRKRIASWARKCNREGTLVNQGRWNLIQKLFPEKCLKRLKGEADDSEDELLPIPKRVLAKSGELREEYQKEMNKILEAKEIEQKASEELINNLLKEERALQLQRENQQRDDEFLARKISEELEQQSSGEDPSRTNSPRIVHTPPLPSEKYKGINKRKRMVQNNKSPRQMSYTLDRYFSSKERSNAASKPPLIFNQNDTASEDLELAKALQKQYDEEAKALSKKDEYVLRKTTECDNVVETSQHKLVDIVTCSNAGHVNTT